MAFPFLPAAALALGGVGILYAFASAPPVTGEVPVRLKPFRWYRIRFSTPPVPPSRPGTTSSRGRIYELFNPGQLIPFPVVDRLKALGFDADSIIYSVGDAQTGATWDAFARYVGPGPADMSKAGVLVADEILNTNPAAPSPAMLPWIGPFQIEKPDPPMNLGLADAIAFAIAHDDDESRLRDFSVSMLPEYRQASGLLSGRRSTVAMARRQRYSISPVLALGKAPGDTPLVGGIFDWDWERIGLAAITGGASEVIPAAIELFEDAVDLIVSVGREVLEIVKTAAPFIQLGLSFIPGIGTVASAALGAGIALASGRPISDVLIAAAKGAFPGGELAANAVIAGVSAIANLAEGQTLGESVLNGIRSGIQSNQGALMAFDTTIALAQGKKIQDAAIAGVQSISPEASTVLGAIADGKPIDGNLLAQAAAARAGLSPDAQAAMSAVTSLAQGGRIEDAAATAARAKLPPSARASFDAALALAQKRNPRDAVIIAAQQAAPNTAAARAAQSMTGAALRGDATPATLAGEAVKFIPNAPAALKGNPSPAQLTEAEASRISSMGPKAFTRPELYLPDADRRRIDAEAQKAALFRDVAAEEERREAERVRVLLSTPGAIKAVDYLKEVFRLAAIKQQAELEVVAASKAAYAAAAKLHEQIRLSWVPIYANLKRTADRGGIPT